MRIVSFSLPVLGLSLSFMSSAGAAPPVRAATPARLGEPPTTAPVPALIPREVLFGNPERANVQISPDGKRISFLAPVQGVMNIWVQSIGTDDEHAITAAKERPISQYFWAPNSEQIIYSQDRGGDENFRVYAVTVADGSEVALTPFDQVAARIVKVDRDHLDDILVALNNRVPQLHDIWKINTRTGKGEMIFQNDDGFAALGADSTLSVRYGLIMKPDGSSVVRARSGADGAWSDLATFAFEDAASSSPLGVSRDGRTLFMTDSSRGDTSALWAFPLDGGAPTLVAANPLADLSDAVFDPASGRPQAVAFEHARMEWTVVDPAFKPDWDAITAAIPGEVEILSRDRADQRWILAALRDAGPTEYYLWDRAAKKATHLFSNRPALEGLPLSPMKPVTIAARDGLKLVSYLTLPAGVPAKDLPLVLLVHGGPWARDSWGFNPLHQWLANRGYAVLSVNFRGSTGFGKSFLNAGNREWSKKMHDDLLDAVAWAVREGIADPKRVAIMGGSYGGYATLVGLTFTPEVFACGVDIVGPSHVATLLRTIPPYWAPMKAMFEQRVGSLEEAEFLDSISPLTKVDEIRRPLLIGQGRNDPRVKESESVQIVEAMERRQIPVTYVVFPDEGHGFARPENRLGFFAVTEAFLGKHLGGAYEPIGEDLARSTAEIPTGAALVPGVNEAMKR